MPEFGMVIFTQHYDTDPPTITIDRADPHVLVSDHVLHEVAVGVGAAHWHGASMRLDHSPQPRFCGNGVGVCEYPSHPFCWTDWLLHLDLPGRHLVYRIAKYRRDQNVWEASWPD